MIVADMGTLALTLVVCWLCGVLLLVFTMLTWPFLAELRFKSPIKRACYGESMSQHESNVSFREWLLQPIIHRIERTLAKNLADLTASIAANTSATNNAVAAFGAGLGDLTPQVTAIDANTAKLTALAPGGTGTGTGTGTGASAITASPASLTFSAGAPTQSVTLTTTSGQPGNFSAVSSNTAIATVSPASGPGPFTVTQVGAGTGTSISFTDAQNNVVTVPVNAA